jgi:hypothetical protein
VRPRAGVRAPRASDQERQRARLRLREIAGALVSLDMSKPGFAARSIE